MYCTNSPTSTRNTIIDVLQEIKLDGGKGPARNIGSLHNYSSGHRYCLHIEKSEN